MIAPDVERILALVPNWLGDAAMCTPALRALRRQFPEAHLTVAGRDAVCQLLEDTPWIDRLVPLPKRPALGQMLRLGWDLRPGARDLCVVFPHSFRAALLARLTGARRRLGYDRGGRKALLTDAPPPYREEGEIVPIYMAREYLDLVAGLGCVDDNAGLELHVSARAAQAVAESLSDDTPVVALAPGAAFGPSKCWPAERYAAVADALAGRTGAQCVLLTGPGEEEARQAVIAAAKHPLIECGAALPGIARLKAIIARADVLIGNDSGPRHVAIAFGKPVICLMGPTSPRYTDSPWERGKILRVEVDCGPCQQPVCTTDHRCMRLISPEQVVTAALAHLPN